MDSKVSESKVSRPTRRSTRQSRGNVKALNVEVTPRDPLNKTKRRLENQAAALNGSRDVESTSEAKEPSWKKRRLETEGGEEEDDKKMDVQESVDDLLKNDQLEMDVEQDFSHSSHQPQICEALNVEVAPRDSLKKTKRRLENQAAAVNGSTDMESASKAKEPSWKKRRLKTGGGEEVGGSNDDKKMDVQESVDDLLKNDQLEMNLGQNFSHSSHQPQICEVNTVYRHNGGGGGRGGGGGGGGRGRGVGSSVEDYKMDFSHSSHRPALTLAAGARGNMNLSPRVVHGGINYRSSRAENEDTKRVKTKRVGKKTAVIKGTSGGSSGRFMWYLCCLVLLVLLSCAVLFIMPSVMAVLQKTGDGAKHQFKSVKLETFADQLSHLETLFLSQRPELWRRSRIHLERHLNTTQPTEPVSLILTAGRRAEKTLHCLAQGLAFAFSSALNASVLHIDGASKTSMNSDEVKLDIDKQLQAAFEGDKPVAVIHRLEELPPGSTLIFYRYCDHENAAYKQVFLLFTVLLPGDEVKGDQSLKNVEEMVQDYVKDRLVSLSNQTTFSDMDIDKYGGLWSRISHLILPVVSEREIEQNGC
ncbi:hypothetical protein PAMA_001488 [Pampus argenteus]